MFDMSSLLDARGFGYFAVGGVLEVTQRNSCYLKGQTRLRPLVLKGSTVIGTTIVSSS